MNAPRPVTGGRYLRDSLIQAILGLVLVIIGGWSAFKGIEGIRICPELLPFGVLACLWGIAMLTFSVTLLREGTKRLADQRRNPTKPWCYAVSHPGFVIPWGAFPHLALRWELVVIFSAFFTSFFYIMRLNPAERSFYQVVLAPFLILHLVGLYRTLYATLQGMVHGGARLVLRQLPIPVGGSLEAKLLVSRPLKAEVIEVTLRCRRQRLRGRSLGRSPHPFEREQTLAVPPDGEGIPIRFDIPPGAYSSGIGDSARSRDHFRYHWELEARASTPGIDFGAVFPDLPVFHVTEPQLVEENPEWGRLQWAR